MNGHRGTGAGRKKGDWIAIAAGRARVIGREVVNGRGLSNIPQLNAVGSAAYRRLLAKRQGRRAA